MTALRSCANVDAPAALKRDPGAVGKTKNGLESARGRVRGWRPVVYADKRRVILARRAEGQSIRQIATGVGVSIGVVHKTLSPAP